MGDYRRLVIWQRAYQLTQAAYRATSQMPRGEMYGLTAQIRRAAVSIPVNIAEGAGRGTDRELRRFAAIARGSAQELIVEIQLCRDLELLPAEVAEPVLRQARRVAVLISHFIKAGGRPPFDGS